MINVPKLRGLIAQAVLPLVYDESLSYYELLCKVIGKINEILQIINEFKPQDLTEIYNRLDVLESVTEQHEIQITEINNVLNELTQNVYNINITVNNLVEQVGTHENELENHEQRITALESIVSYYMQPVNIENAMNETEMYPYEVREVAISNE